MPMSRLHSKVSWLACAFALLSFVLAASAQDRTGKDQARSDFNLSVGADKKATAKDVGLPAYPGARPHKDDKDESAASQLWAWYNNSGFKLVVLKFESEDSPEKISAFYRRELSKYGEVLDCSTSAKTANEKDKTSSHGLECDDKEVQVTPGHVQLKAGTKREQHLVNIEPSGSGTTFQLLYVKSRSEADDHKEPI